LRIRFSRGVDFGILERCGELDSTFQKTTFLARPFGRRPAKQVTFARLAFQKPANSRFRVKFHNSTLRDRRTPSNHLAQRAHR
jgi:hypothetical protein